MVAMAMQVSSVLMAVHVVACRPQVNVLNCSAEALQVRGRCCLFLLGWQHHLLASAAGCTATSSPTVLTSLVKVSG